MAFTPDQQQLLSVGDAIFLWDILGPLERSPPGRQVPALELRPLAFSYVLPSDLSLPLQCRRLTRGAPDLQD